MLHYSENNYVHNFQLILKSFTHLLSELYLLIQITITNNFHSHINISKKTVDPMPPPFSIKGLELRLKTFPYHGVSSQYFLTEQPRFVYGHFVE